MSLPTIPHDANSEDAFAETRMTFGDHLEELRTHLLRALKGFLAAFFFSFLIAWYVLRMIAQPIEDQLMQFYARREAKVTEALDRNDRQLQPLNQPLTVSLALPAKDIARQIAPAGQEAAFAAASEGKTIRTTVQIVEPLRLAAGLNRALMVVGRRPALATMSLQEGAIAFFKVCLACGLVLGSPWIFYQLWLFVAAGLYPHEKRLVNVYVPVSVALFLGGVLLCQFFVMPKAIEALLWFNEWLGYEPDLRLNEWLSFAILLPLVFGISFQLPLVMLFLNRIGLCTVHDFARHWKIAILLIHVFAAVITPTPDIVNMELLALPMLGLYGLGILLCMMRAPADRPSRTSSLGWYGLGLIAYKLRSRRPPAEIAQNFNHGSHGIHG